MARLRPIRNEFCREATMPGAGYVRRSEARGTQCRPQLPDWLRNWQRTDLVALSSSRNAFHATATRVGAYQRPPLRPSPRRRSPHKHRASESNTTIAMQSLRSLARTSTRAFSTSAPRPLAKLQLIGRLADSPEVLPTSTGRELIKFSMGVSQGRRDEEGNRSVSWFEIASFVEGPQRDLLLSLPKG